MQGQTKGREIGRSLLLKSGDFNDHMFDGISKHLHSKPPDLSGGEGM